MDGLRMYILTNVKEEHGSYIISVYDQNHNKVIGHSGESYPIDKRRLDLLAIAEGLELIEEKVPIAISINSDYAISTLVNKDDHRKNRDLYSKCMSMMSRRITIKQRTARTIRKHTL